MSVWFVSSSGPGLQAFLREGCVAVNFWVREPVAGLSPQEVRELVAVVDGPDLLPGTRTRFANQLVAFLTITPGEQVVTFDRRDRQSLYVGDVIGGPGYESPPRIDAHPHVVPVKWTGTVQRSNLPDGGAAIPHTPAMTVARIYDTLGVPLPPMAVPTEKPRTPRAASSRATSGIDGFSWDPPEGPHRYRLVQTFGRVGEPERPFVVFMVNPGGNDIDRIRRSTTCHRVRAWGMAHGFDGASYLNLFSAVTNDVSGLAAVHPEHLNGPDANDVICDVLERIGGVVVAGWGNPCVERSLFDDRVREVRDLVGDRLKCLGLTGVGYPKHGRHWDPEDELIEMP